MSAERDRARILRFAEIGLDDLGRVGGKNASLGELYRNLSPHGVRVPDGFAVTAAAYREFLRDGGLEADLSRLLSGLDARDVPELRRRGREVRQRILSAELPTALGGAILDAYRQLTGEAGFQALDVAVRSSATAEDLPDASFAGQQESFLNIQGEHALLDACKRCYASLFTDRAISYRAARGYDHLKVSLSIGVQRMVRSDRGAAGVMFTLDTETGFREVVLINAAYGLGETVVQGTVNPDEYYVFKPTLRQGKRPILQKTLGTKEFKLVYAEGGARPTRPVPVTGQDRDRFVLDDEDILALARWACLIEEHYSAQRGEPVPMDIEWAKDGVSGELFVVQARPETIQSRKDARVLEEYRLERRGRVIIEGRSVGSRIGSGLVQIIRDAKEIESFRDGSVLVTDMTDPDWEPVMRRAAAIVTNRGGRTCHAAIVSREIGVPAVIGTGKATDLLCDGQLVTVSCADGETGRVYEGALPFHVERTELEALARPRTRIQLNVADPSEALRLSFLPNDGVGLAREEFIIARHIRVHPLALVHHAELKDVALKAQIDGLTRGYANKVDFFVERLAQGVAMIAAAFYPKEVIVRLSDFKTNEYARLVGGERFEPHEENPMIGFRGASRYYDARYREGFALECRALRKVREEMGLTNVKIMIPFCRTLEEARRVQAEMAAHGLRRGEDGLELFVMCEIPSNVVLADQFAELFDGFSIGSNDLTQLTLGVDRDSDILAPLFDERDPAVGQMLAWAIQAAKRAGRKIGICGQAPSDYPEVVRFLVEQGIDSLSLNPDAVIRTTQAVLDAEGAAARMSQHGGKR
jgi:pyruvate, water dikinase